MSQPATQILKEEVKKSVMRRFEYQTGGPLETRTPDPLIKSQLLYQLS